MSDDTERCGVCQKDDFWTLFDTFQAMDKRRAGAIRRTDFRDALLELGCSVEFQRLANRAKLANYFKETAQDLAFEELVRRVFPTASASDMTRMLRWADLRKARNMLTRGDVAANLHDVFNLLLDESSIVSPAELLRAQILPRAQVLALLPAHAVTMPLSFKQFCTLIRHWHADAEVDKEQEVDTRLKGEAYVELPLSPVPPCSPPRPGVRRPALRVDYSSKDSPRKDKSKAFIRKNMTQRAGVSFCHMSGGTE